MIDYRITYKWDRDGGYLVTAVDKSIDVYYEGIRVETVFFHILNKGLVGERIVKSITPRDADYTITKVDEETVNFAWSDKRIYHVMPLKPDFEDLMNGWRIKLASRPVSKPEVPGPRRRKRIVIL